MDHLEMDLEGVDELTIGFLTGMDVLANDLANIVVEACVAAMFEMQTNHPYTDRTNLLTQGMKVRRFGRMTRTRAEAILTFDAPYANIVNDGSVKSRAYPFMPQGERRAGVVLMTGAFNALSRFIGSLGMGR